MKKHEVYRRAMRGILRDVELLCEALTPYPEYWLEWIGGAPSFFVEDGKTTRMLGPQHIDGLSRHYRWGPKFHMPPGHPEGYIQRVSAGDMERILASKSGHEFRIRVIKPPKVAPEAEDGGEYEVTVPMTPEPTSASETYTTGDHRTYAVPVASVPEIEDIVERRLRELGVVNESGRNVVCVAVTRDEIERVVDERIETLSHEPVIHADVRTVYINAIDRLIARIDTRYGSTAGYSESHIHNDREIVRQFLDEHKIPHD